MLAASASGSLTQGCFGSMQVLDIHMASLGAQHPRTLTDMHDFGDGEAAEKLSLHVLETRKTKYEVEYPDTLKIMNNLTRIYIEQNRWEEAGKLTYMNQGRWEEAMNSQLRWKDAEKLFLPVLECFKIQLRTEHPYTLSTMHNLAVTDENQGRWEEAEKLLLQVVWTFYTKHNDENPNTLMSMNDLATTYIN
ncbi:hypothetical protein P885DRAFT_62974 [Corynascus similis CBS 632.67]